MIELDTLYNRDCMEGMKEIPDGYFDIAVVDPPYGIGMDGQHESVDLRGGGRRLYRKKHENYGWDKTIPGEDYFRELERVSREQIIFGANYFVEHLHKGTKGWIVWDKAQHGLTMSDCEFARNAAGEALIVIFDGMTVSGIVKPDSAATVEAIQRYLKYMSLLGCDDTKTLQQAIDELPDNVQIAFGEVHARPEDYEGMEAQN